MHDAVAPAVTRVHAVVDDHAVTTVIALVIADIGIIVVGIAIVIGRIKAEPQDGADRKAWSEAVAVVKAMIAAAPASAVKATSVKTAEAAVEATAAEPAMAARPVR